MASERRSASAQSRPQSRASTMSVTSQHNDEVSAYTQQGSKQPQLHASDAEAILFQFPPTTQPPEGPQPGVTPLQQPHLGQPHAPSAPFAMQNVAFSHEPPYAPQEQMYTNHVRMGSVPVQSGAETADDKRRKGSAVTASNDRELREMLAKNEGRPLRDVAQEVIQKERTPMAEKTKQLFAMLWLRAVCKPAKTSVPRNRVYSQYASRCGTERVVPLNPASFGKLVRVIFPGIQTRRLGVRGESKYHYVDLALDDENLNPITNPNFGAYHQMDNRPRRSESVGTPQIDFSTMPRLQADTAAFPTAEQSYEIHQALPSSSGGSSSRARAFAFPDTRGMQPGTAEAMSYPHRLRFPLNTIPQFTENEPVNLPPMQPYLPPRTDMDTAEALCALYRTHCTSLIDSIRFCKEKQFFRLYTSFHGTLTVPVQKLFTHPNMAGWIEQCDLVMYRTMVRFVSRLTLQAAPVVVINVLSNISANLHSHIAKTFSSQPPHLLEAKLRPATVFAGLLYRLIRVNQSAHAAANLLTIDQNREQMWREWATMVNPKRVMEAELPDCGYEEVYRILTTEMRRLLEPLKMPSYEQDPYGFSAYHFEENGGFAQFLQGQTQTLPPGQQNAQSSMGVSTENVLDRWATFLQSLPSQFPHASARTLLHCISAVGTAALRDITIMNGLSYGHWWVLKIFVDEMALWLAEMGGFLEPTIGGAMTNGIATYQSPIIQSTNDRSHSGSRMSNTPSGEMNGDGAYMPPNSQPQQQTHMPSANVGQISSHRAQDLSFQSQRSQAPPVETKSQGHHQQQHIEADLDDSGIGMSLMDDDIPLSKFGVTGSHGSMGATEMRVESL